MHTCPVSAAAHRLQVICQLTNLRHSSCAVRLLPHSLLYSEVPMQRLTRRSGHGCARWRHTAAVGRDAATDKPEWLRDLEADAAEDPDIAKLLEGTNGDPDVVQERMRRYISKVPEDMVGDRTGQQEQMKVALREVDPFSLWLWMEMFEPPSEGELEMVEDVLKSWFMVGRLGGYNGMNLQVFNNATDEGASFLQYDSEECESGLDALFHDISNTERKGNWLRTWVNLGTADELALDVLINMLSNFSRENIGIKQLILGGENEDWKVPDMQLPKGTMDPMQTNMPFDFDGSDMLDDE